MRGGRCASCLQLLFCSPGSWARRRAQVGPGVVGTAFRFEAIFDRTGPMSNLTTAPVRAWEQPIAADDSWIPAGHPAAIHCADPVLLPRAARLPSTPQCQSRQAHQTPTPGRSHPAPCKIPEPRRQVSRAATTGSPSASTARFACSTEPSLHAWRQNQWCPGAESNHRHCDFQSHALPTELPGRAGRPGGACGLGLIGRRLRPVQRNLTRWCRGGSMGR